MDPRATNATVDKVDIFDVTATNCCHHSLTTETGCPFLVTSSPDDVNTAENCCRHWPILLLSVLVVAGLTGNTLVCCAVAIERKLRNVTNYFLVSLAVTDLLVSIVVMPACIAHDFIGYWPFGLILCNTWQFVDVTLCTSSIMHMCTISLDRYAALRCPLTSRRRRSKSTVSIRIAGVWFVSVAIASPLIAIGVQRPGDLLFDPDSQAAVNDRFDAAIADYSGLTGDGSWPGGRPQCAIFNEHYLIYGSLAAFFGPLCVMLITYALTIRLLRRRAAQVEQRMRDGTMRRTMSQRQRQRSSVVAAGGGSTGQGLGEATGCLRRPVGGSIGNGNRSGSTLAASETCSLRRISTIPYGEPRSPAHGQTNRVVRPLSSSSGTNFRLLRKPEIVGNGDRDSAIGCDVTNATSTSTLQLMTSAISSSWSPLPVTSMATPADDEDNSEVDTVRRSARVSFHQDDNSSGEDAVSLELLRDEVSSVDRRIRSRHHTNSSTYGSSKIVGGSGSASRLRWMALNRSLQSTGEVSEHCGKEISTKQKALLVGRHCRDLDSAMNLSRDTVVGSTEVSSGAGIGGEGGLSEETDSDRTPADFSTGSTSSRTPLTSFQTTMAPRHHAVVRLATALATGNRSLSTTSLRRPIVDDLISAQPSPADAASSSSSPSTTRRFRFLLSLGGSRSTGTGNFQSSGSTPSSSLTGVQTERKAIKVVGTMFVLFVACWASFFVVNLTSGVCRNCQIDERLFKSFLWLGYASSTVNPIIYTIFNRSFKRTFIRILTCSDCSSASAV